MSDYKKATEASVRKACQAYQDAVRRQYAMPEDQMWTMASEVKRLKAAALAELEEWEAFKHDK